MINFVILIILHLLGDFYLQTNKMAKCKNAKVDEMCANCRQCKQGDKFNFKFLFIHTLTYIIPFLILFFITNWIVAVISIFIFFIAHYFIDMYICCLNKKLKQTTSLLIDQGLHILTLYAAYILLPYNAEVSAYYIYIKAIFVVLILAVPASVVIDKLLEDVFNDAQGKVFDIGSIIGVLERILVIIFAYFGDFSAIAIIITVKTWARSGDFNKERFREKYLLGTLSSLVLALITFLFYKLV